MKARYGLWLLCTITVHSSDHNNYTSQKTIPQLTKKELQDIEINFLYVPIILHDDIVLWNYSDTLFNAHIEGVNLYEINPYETITSPFKLRYTQLTDTVTIQPYRKHQFTYTYNILPNKYENELLFMYSRICCTYASNNYYFMMPESERCFLPIISFTISSNHGVKWSTISNTIYKKKGIPSHTDITPNIRYAHFIMFNAKNPEYNPAFMKKCFEYFLSTTRTDEERMDKILKGTRDVVRAGELTY